MAKLLTEKHKASNILFLFKLATHCLDIGEHQVTGIYKIIHKNVYAHFKLTLSKIAQWTHWGKKSNSML